MSEFSWPATDSEILSFSPGMAGVTIRIKNIYSHVVTKDSHLLRRLRSAFTFEEEGTKYSRHLLARRKGAWAYGASLGTHMS